MLTKPQVLQEKTCPSHGILRSLSLARSAHLYASEPTPQIYHEMHHFVIIRLFLSARSGSGRFEASEPTLQIYHEMHHFLIIKLFFSARSGSGRFEASVKHCKYRRFLGPLCLALQIPTIPWGPMLGIANTHDSLGRYAWHCKYRRFLRSLCLALQIPTIP